MANEWNVSYPIDHTLISAVPGEIRKLKTSAKAQLDMEHETPQDGDATGSEHSSGSSVAYEGTSTPTNRPDGATALANNAIDRGRTWIDQNKTQIPLKRWSGSAFVTVGMSPSAYGGEESIIFPNGLIVKHGIKTSVGAGDTTITFAAAFPTACSNAFTCFGEAQGAGQDSPSAKSLAAESFVIDNPSGSVETVNWFAIGY